MTLMFDTKKLLVCWHADAYVHNAIGDWCVTSLYGYLLDRILEEPEMVCVALKEFILACIVSRN